jgi:uncharacterized cupin superfamily protein
MRITALRLGAGEPSPDVHAYVEGLSAAEAAGAIWDPERPGMHRSDTIDVGVVVGGEVAVVAPDGSSVVLRPGDVYVQNGAMHQWRPTDPDDPAHVVFVALGVERQDASR